MSIASEISRIQTNVASAYSALSAKGATMPSLQNTANLASAIESIQSGEAMSRATIWNICGYEPPSFERDYVELEYIQSSGTQYIDTGFKPNNNTRVVLSAYNASTSSGWTYGAWDSSSSNQFAFSCLSTYSFRYGSGGVQLTTLPVGDFEVDQNKNAYNLNGTSGTITAQMFSCSHTMYLFAINANGAVSSGKFTGRIKKCQIYDNGVLIRDYVPCKKKKTGDVGLYDKVGGKFYGNAGTGSFVASVDLPVGYNQLAYIQSSGTQHIDTGFKPNGNSRVEMDVEVLTGTTSFLFGARNNSSANSTSYSFSMVQISGASLRSDYGSVETAISVSPVQRLSIDKNGNATKVNGTAVTATMQSFSCSYNLTLLTVNTAGTINSTKTSAKLYSCQIYDNGTMVRDYIPCKNPSGAYGLYDMVNAKFYANAGSGSFTGV